MSTKLTPELLAELRAKAEALLNPRSHHFNSQTVLALLDRIAELEKDGQCESLSGDHPEGKRCQMERGHSGQWHSHLSTDLTSRRWPR